ncbi:3-(3-hydroxy-phenyl)propionate/3-hydroxycinnamic acid hydroxylase [Marinobacterium nitratireducens]|uniref:3-(3-hydroxy-phenyl)propionate/3-hydroxycinnamic acid hydroxylase n=1 Tax=Marinobacterium nitratireducens TaxID=518897 RepID=A0A917ZKM0_9GAMM|nr:bifunctional 3-(3-hydroxy-phenyl)propionate/3-hydroxycinnamic acid hydroxylase [Marinobacterium nitratireducens]GGO85411.1 3-(3-hydroxy-phenyl)propionate/3-hydroxycinnamic acid hydroxylase [Marinobacterium nitratireducens]
MDIQKTEVVIVGAGPNGVTLANYMGMYGINTVVIDSSEEILPFPRAVGMDDEAMRVLQGVGLAEIALKDMIRNVPLRYYNARGVCFAEVKPTTAKYGWPMRNIFMQHLTEVTLREGLNRFENVELCLGHTMNSIDQDDDRVSLQVTDSQGVPYRLDASIVIAADGGRSDIRNQLDIGFSGQTHPAKWVVVDAVNDKLDAPFTALHADPERPFVCIHLPYQYRRWEFMLHPGEDEQKMCEEEVIRGLIRNHIGAMVDELEIVRIRAYTHNSRVADTFVKGRVLLCGDAAHISPPWAGQGLNSGLRDVVNIGWKVAAVIKGRAPKSILQTYDQERRGHATDLVALADNMGAVLGMTNPILAGVRDWIFKASDSVDPLREHLAEFKFKPKAHITRGIVHHEGDEIYDDSLVGQLFVQPDVEDVEGRRTKFDEVLGSWFSIVGFRTNPAEFMSDENKAFWDQLETRYIQVNRSRSGHSHDARLQASGAVSVEDVDNVLADWFGTARNRIVIVRPDRFIAAITSPGRLNETLDALRAKLS